jgi:hypothetical protein
MAGANAQQAAQKWAQNMAQAGQTITNGVNNTTKDPIALAIAAIPTAAANYAAAASSGRIQAGLQKSSKAAWQQGMIKKGVPRIAEGAAQAQSKVAAKLQTIIANVNTAVSALPPRGSLEQNLQRAAQFARAMAATKGQA